MCITLINSLLVIMIESLYILLSLTLSLSNFVNIIFSLTSHSVLVNLAPTFKCPLIYIYYFLYSLILSGRQRDCEDTCWDCISGFRVQTAGRL